MRVKIFIYSQSTQHTEDRINEWLKEYNDIEIIAMTQTETDTSFMITILYKP